MATNRLGDYRGRRDFTRTDEPPGAKGGGPGAGGSRFVVHKHHASSPHYDLRLELGGVLKSWAVPKGPSLDPGEKRLAVETEDHPLEYADFEGVIPAGEYGGGPTIVWDAGVWAPMGAPESDLAAGAFKFRLAGAKLTGGWMLARLRPKPGEGRPAWLLFKERDAEARPGFDILAARPESVKTGRRIEELTAEAQPAGPRPRRLRPGALPGAARAALPDRIEPQLASPAPQPPAGAGWIHEIKLDGYRTMAHVAAGGARLITRGGLDWTRRYGDLPASFAALPCHDAVIDGEVVALDSAGVSRFALLQEALSRGAGGRLVFFAFDLVHLDGWSIAGTPLLRRKALLADLLAGGDARSAVQFSDHVAGSGPDFFARASEMGLEGVVSKQEGAPYQSGRSRTWTKSKARAVGDFVILGYTTSREAGGLAALAVGEWQEDALAFRGKVGTGFDAATLRELGARLEALRSGAPPLEGAPKGVIPVRPVLTAHVHYANRTADGMLRHAVFRGLRELAPAISAVPASRRPRLIADADLAAISITNPRRRLFGRSGPTKLDVAVYYAAIGEAMLPHLLGRPVSLVRCPTGRPEDCFFQRHAFAGMPPSVATFETGSSDGEVRTYLAVEDARGYLALAQFGVVEFHSWGALRRRLEKPDRIVLDLDPGEGVTWRAVVAAALHVREQLAGLGLAPFAKTTGGRGVHVVVPVAPKRGWKAVHEATRALAGRIAATAPETFTTVMGPANRRNRIFIDFHRNVRGATAAAPYSLRAKPHLPASAPLGWAELEAVDDPADLNYASLPGLVSASGDPWAEIGSFARDLPG